MPDATNFNLPSDCKSGGSPLTITQSLAALRPSAAYVFQSVQSGLQRKILSRKGGLRCVQSSHRTRAHPPGLSRLPLSMQIRFGGAGPRTLTVGSTRFRYRLGLMCRANLRRRQQSARLGQKTLKWLRARKLRTTDGSAAQTLRLRALNTWRLQPRVTMSRLSARYAQLIKMCRRRGCPREDAKELVQEAHRRLFEYQRSTRVRDVDSLLRRIVINLSITYFNRELSTPAAFESLDRFDDLGELIDPVPGLDRVVAAEQQLDGVLGVLSAVSPRTCQIFIAQRGGYTYEEIATAFGVKPRTVEKHVASAMLLLREIMPMGFAVP